MRTARRLLVLNYALTLKESDDTFYCEWTQLKRHLSRKELIALIRNVRVGRNYLTTDGNPNIHQVVGV